MHMQTSDPPSNVRLLNFNVSPLPDGALRTGFVSLVLQGYPVPVRGVCTCRISVGVATV
jgi:hypothetical protein